LGITQDYLASQLQRCHVAICPMVMGSGVSRDTQLKDDVAMLSSGHPGAMPFVQRWCPGWRGQV
jgi:hypothetical protein